MAFKLGKKSEAELVGVHPDLVRVVRRALELTPQDFSVTDGLRTLAEQRHYVAIGASQTMDSRHLTGHAVDLVPYVLGRPRWEWTLIYPIALAMRVAAREQDVPLRWGGCWDVLLTDSDEAPEDLVNDYVQRRRAAGRRVFIDGPHYELPVARYP